MTPEAIIPYGYFLSGLIIGWVFGNIWTAWVFKVGPFEKRVVGVFTLARNCKAGTKIKTDGRFVFVVCDPSEEA